VLRTLALKAARQPTLRKLAMSTPGFRDIAWRVVAGEDLPAGVAAVRSLNEAGIAGTLNVLGMHVTDPDEAAANTQTVIRTLRAIRDEGIDSHLSLKLTAIGLEVDEATCRRHLWQILEVARETGVFVRIDQEEVPHVDGTMRLYEEAVGAFGHQIVGIVIQSYLRNPPYALAELAAGGSRIRLVKGGYREPEAHVLRDHIALDAAFRRDIELLLRDAHQPAIATHDTEAVAWTLAVQRSMGLPSDAFEFQLLYGVRPDLQRLLATRGYRVRSYVPFGGNWLNWLLLAAHGAWHRLEGRLRAPGGRAS
jgi:proline dehydrogenase